MELVQLKKWGRRYAMARWAPGFPFTSSTSTRTCTGGTCTCRLTGLVVLRHVLAEPAIEEAVTIVARNMESADLVPHHRLQVVGEPRGGHDVLAAASRAGRWRSRRRCRRAWAWCSDWALKNAAESAPLQWTSGTNPRSDSSFSRRSVMAISVGLFSATSPSSVRKVWKAAPRPGRPPRPRGWLHTTVVPGERVGQAGAKA